MVRKKTERGIFVCLEISKVLVYHLQNSVEKRITIQFINLIHWIVNIKQIIKYLAQNNGNSYYIKRQIDAQ